MLFSSITFLFFFLPIALGLYFISPNRYRNFLLFLLSLFFYAWGEDKIVLVMLFSVVVDYSCGIIIEKGMKKTGLILSILTNIGLLGFFKYFNFTFENLNTALEFFNLEHEGLQNLPYIALPIGISFYTFQTMSYTIDVYRGKVKANRNFIDFGAYVTMFPQLVAGPIVRYIDIEKQLIERKLNWNKFSEGSERFIIGLAKKVLIANSMASIADGIFAQNIGDVSTPMAWLGILAYTFQIYFDFSGYSDMAIGLGKMLGFDFLENFNYPYISKSITEFWRRWHISLSTWFRDYLYITLGGNRVGKWRLYFNLALTFLVTGFWHGASWNFIVWGAFHGLFLSIEKFLVGNRTGKINALFGHIYTLLVVVLGWVIFRADTMADALKYFKQLFVFDLGDVALNSYLTFHHINAHTLLVFTAAILFSMPVYTRLSDFSDHVSTGWLRPVSTFVIFFLTISYLTADTYNPFIYFRF